MDSKQKTIQFKSEFNLEDSCRDDIPEKYHVW